MEDPECKAQEARFRVAEDGEKHKPLMIPSSAIAEEMYFLNMARRSKGVGVDDGGFQRL